MRMIDLDFRPDTRRLRQFAGAAVVAFALLGVLAHWRGHVLGIDLGSSAPTVAAVLWSAAGLSLLLAAAWPRGIWPLYVLLMLVAFPVGTVISYVVLLFIFYVLITPVGLWFRLRGRDLLARRGGRVETTWRDARADRGPESYFRQF